MSTVISLCDLTGHMVQPWVDAGYNAVLVDPQHGMTKREGRTLKIAGTVLDATETIGSLIRAGKVAAVFGFPPCTDMAVSGARWFKNKHAADPLFQAKAVMVAEQCRTIGMVSGAPWFVENPVSVLATPRKPVYGLAAGSLCPSRLRTGHWVDRITGFTLHPLGRSGLTSALLLRWVLPVRCLRLTRLRRWRHE